jgi:hypothetical protein
MAHPFYCWDHEIVFKNAQDYQQHHGVECTTMLDAGPVCTYVRKSGKVCGKSYKHVSSLIYHYRCVHKLYACVHCYAVFERKEQLHTHEHIDGRNLRESK